MPRIVELTAGIFYVYYIYIYLEMLPSQLRDKFESIVNYLLKKENYWISIVRFHKC